jgi:protein involved in polysaccharide export with SLBB domain
MRRICAVLLAAATPVLAASLRAQDLYDWDVGRTQLTRQALVELEGRLQRAAASPAYSDRLREQARQQAEVIRRRLTEGDFQVGDRVYVRIQGTTPLAPAAGTQTLPASDTLVVGPDRGLQLQGYGRVSLAGVLRAELQAVVARHVTQLERGATVEARSLIRIAVLGTVGRPGYYVVPSERLVENVIMLAGGPTSESALHKMKIERDGGSLWEGQLLRRAIAEGQTLDALSLHNGDVISIPRRTVRSWEVIARVASVAITLPAALYGLTRLIF